MSQQITHARLMSKLKPAAYIVLVFILGVYCGAEVFKIENRAYLNEILIDNSIYRQLTLSRMHRDLVKPQINPVPCPNTYKSVAIFGHSNFTNVIERKEGLLKFNDSKTFMFDWVSGECYHYYEPLVGTEGEGGNIISKTILKYRKEDPESNILVIAFGKGGSSVFSWALGDDSIRLDTVLAQLKQKEIRIDLALWHQGETDAVYDNFIMQKYKTIGMRIGTVRELYKEALSIIVNKIHNNQPMATVGVAIASICQNNGSEEIRQAQHDVIHENDFVFVSSNTDLYGANARADGCHFNETGEELISADYLKLISKSRK